MSSEKRGKKKIENARGNKKVSRDNNFTRLRLVGYDIAARDEATRDFEHARRCNFCMQIIAHRNGAQRRCSLKSYNCIPA